MILNEANDLSFNDTYKKTSDILEKRDVIKEFGKQSNMKGFNTADWESFVDNNYTTLIIECDYFGLSMDNPFMMFLNEYGNKNGNIKPFINIENYDLLHNLVSDRVLSIKQVSWTCPEEDQIRILVNPNLWNISSKDDVDWLIKTYCWFLEEDLNRVIKNSYVRAAFSKTVFDDLNNINKVVVDFNEKGNRETLIRALFFTQYINELSDSKLKLKIKTTEDNNEYVSKEIEEVRNKIDSIRNNNFLVSHQFENCDIIEQQIKVLNELVQESSRNSEGEYQSTDIDNNEDNNDDYLFKSNLNQQQKRFIQSKKTDIVNSLSNFLGSRDRNFIRDALKYIGDNL
jgi:hypothetical protein